MKITRQNQNNLKGQTENSKKEKAHKIFYILYDKMDSKM